MKPSPKKITGITPDPLKDNFSQAVLKTVRESLLVLDKNLRVKSANDSFYKTFRVTPRATEGKLIYKMGGGQWNIPELRTLLEEILPKKNYFENFEVDHKFPDIGRKIMLLNARQLRDGTKGQEPMILLAIENITKRKQLENKLAEYVSGLEEKIAARTKNVTLEKIRMEAILQSLGDGLIVLIDVDKGGKITYVNKAFEEMTGWKAREVMNKSAVDIVPREDRDGKIIPLKERLMTKILSGEKIVTDLTQPFYYVRKDKSRFPAASIITPIVLDKKIIGAVETFRDITKECAVDKLKTEFVSLVSHQLRSPFATINWCVELLLSEDLGQLNEEQVQYLREVYHVSKRMVNLISALLTVSKIELGTPAVKTKANDIVFLAEMVLKENEVEIRKKKLKIEKNYAKNIPQIQVSNGQLNIILQNLISNAIKYTPDGGKIKIDIGFEKKDIMIAVSDTGMGIPQDVQSKVFTRFFRANNAKKQDPEGSGLGLYIVKTITDQMEGKIRFESRENKGTTFYIMLPIVDVKPK